MTPSSLIIASSYLLPRFEGGTRTSISNYIILGRPPVQITSLFLASWSLFLPFIRGNRSENKNKQKEIGSGGVIVSYASLCSRSPGQSIRLQLICDFARSHGLEHLIAQQARVPACLTRRTLSFCHSLAMKCVRPRRISAQPSMRNHSLPLLYPERQK